MSEEFKKAVEKLKGLVEKLRERNRQESFARFRLCHPNQVAADELSAFIPELEREMQQAKSALSDLVDAVKDYRGADGDLQLEVENAELALGKSSQPSPQWKPGQMLVHIDPKVCFPYYKLGKQTAEGKWTYFVWDMDNRVWHPGRVPEACRFGKNYVPWPRLWDWAMCPYHKSPVQVRALNDVTASTTCGCVSLIADLEPAPPPYDAGQASPPEQQDIPNAGPPGTPLRVYPEHRIEKLERQLKELKRGHTA